MSSASMPSSIPAPPREHTEFVRRRMRNLMAERGLAAAVAMGADNSYYLSGYANFTLADTGLAGGSFGLLPGDSEAPFIVVDAEYHIANYPVGEDVVTIDYPTWIFIDNPLGVTERETIRDLEPEANVDVAIRKFVQALRTYEIVGPVGVDRTYVQWDIWEKLVSAVPHSVELVDATELFAVSRQIKSAWEVEQLEAATQISERGITDCARVLGPGTTAAQLRRTFAESVTRDARYTGTRFCLINVGPEFAPVAYPGREVPAQLGDVIKFDLGVEVRGYGADLARTFCVGSPHPLVAARYEALLAGQQVLVAGAVAGRKIGDLFAETMSAVHAAGFPEYVRGHLGHSIGLWPGIEESPQIAPHSTQTIEVDMVLSLETPYYAYGIGALNIEDTVHVTADGPRLLTHLPKTLRPGGVIA